MQVNKAIVILLSPFISHIISTLRMMKLLQQKGYYIVYVSEPHLEKAVVRYGFSFHPSGLAKTAFAKRDAEGLKALIQTLIQCYNPCLFVAEVGFWDSALMIHGLNHKVMMIQPWACTLKAGHNLQGQQGIKTLPRRIMKFLKHEASWGWINFMHWCEGLQQRSPHNGYLREVLRTAGLPKGNYLTRYNTVSYHRVVGVPELILYPRELDFPRRLFPDLRFIGPFVDEERKEYPFDWSQLKKDRSIVVCSLGSLSFWYADEKRYSFYNRVIEAFAKDGRYNLLLNIGDMYEHFCRESYPDNIYLYRSIPQITLLKRAAYFITHGGAGSMKEALLMGVPMLVYPWSRDSDMFQNASRIRYHQLGIIGNIETDTVADIERHVKKLESGKYTAGIQQMQAIFRQYQCREDQEINWIETYIMGRAICIKQTQTE